MSNRTNNRRNGSATETIERDQLNNGAAETETAEKPTAESTPPAETEKPTDQTAPPAETEKPTETGADRLHRRGIKPTTKFYMLVDGQLTTGTSGGRPSAGQSIDEFVAAAAAVATREPNGPQFIDPTTQKPKPVAGVSDVVPGADCVEFLAHRIAPAI